MRLKLTRNIGREDLKSLGLVADQEDMAAALAKYTEGSLHNFDKDVAEVLVKRGLAGEDDGVPPPDIRVPSLEMRGVSPAPPIATPANFSDNPHDPSKKGK